MRALVVILASVGVVCVCQGRIITVDDDGPADFNNIQAAIDDANDGDTVEVQPGRYTGHGNRDIDFKGKAITVRSTDPNDPNIVATTIIDANGTESDPHRGLYFHSGEEPNSVLAGLTITNGYAESGGGIFCDSSNPTITKCSIEMNHALEGGGIWCINASLKISSSSIEYNSAGYGGGIHSFTSSLVITRCTIAQNQGVLGGGIHADSSHASISYCHVSDNVAAYGGGFRGVNGSTTISYCTFRGNRAYEFTEPFGSLFEGGGGVHILNGSAEVDHCTFTGNSTQSTGAGLSVSSTCSGGKAEVANCTFAHNRATLGGAASAKGCHSCRLSLRNCIIWANEPVDDPGVYRRSYGFCGHPNIYVDSSIVQALSDDHHVHITDYIVADPCFVVPGYLDANGTPEDANDDFWVDGDYHLKSQAGRWDPNSQSWVQDDVTSPCIDAGDPMSPIGYEPFPNGGIINMGAYGGTAEASKSYFGKPPCEIIIAGDINGDCIVDFRDFSLMSLHWLENNNP